MLGTATTPFMPVSGERCSERLSGPSVVVRVAERGNEGALVETVPLPAVMICVLGSHSVDLGHPPVRIHTTLICYVIDLGCGL